MMQLAKFQDQLNADIKARERNNITGGDATKADADLESEVRSKLSSQFYQLVS